MVYGLGSILPRVLNFLILTTFYTYLFGVKPYGILSELYAYLTVVLGLLISRFSHDDHRRSGG